MRTAHDLLDVSHYGGRHLICVCGHWSWRASWQTDGEHGQDEYEEHRALWRAAEAELDEVEGAA